jgi:hypothetical protein
MAPIQFWGEVMKINNAFWFFVLMALVAVAAVYHIYSGSNLLLQVTFFLLQVSFLLCLFGYKSAIDEIRILENMLKQSLNIANKSTSLFLGMNREFIEKLEASQNYEQTLRNEQNRYHDRLKDSWEKYQAVENAKNVSGPVPGIDAEAIERTAKNVASAEKPATRKARQPKSGTTRLQRRTGQVGTPENS